MIPEIGIMIGLYVISRMAEMILRPRQNAAAQVLVMIPAVVTILATLFILMDLFTRGNTAIPGLPR